MDRAAAVYTLGSIAGAISFLAGLSAAADPSIPAESLAACPPFPEIPFERQPAYLPSNTLALTFDDGPDLVNTPKVLDVLARESVPATFFINAESWTSLRRNEAARDIVRRIVEDGHILANHTARHMRISRLSPERIEEEIAGVEIVVREILGSEAPRLTLFRAPFGDPYTGNRWGPTFRKVAPIVARHAVHVGWSITPTERACPSGAGLCVAASAQRQLDRGYYGVVLLHSTQAETAAGLAALIAEARRRGMRFVSVEDVVRARYQRSSAELVDDPLCTGATRVCPGRR
ncbi:polysaccharide deacetylase family protein [Polyangium sp. 15x6]|uniref:polysaccharide deacetylase family protein n=1 Tax=Polyangium sp. 15x6 TaxID=3042687 RepID=UPI00249C39C5|nr:polysaccharide deacetylase family protein [Polyangium sp. 15x6]MDI3285568.1 polysaccharide deacetylase family protein [Polyangium sp. 15x6]